MTADSAPDADHIVLYDGNCGFCKWMMAAVLIWDRRARLRPLALQCDEAGRLLADLTPEEQMASWHLVLPDGSRRSGGAAIAPLLRVMPAGRLPATVAAHLPGPLDTGYRWVANHRMQLSRFVPARWKRHASDTVARISSERALSPTDGRFRS